MTHELRDQEELVRRICEMDTEHQRMSQEISRLKDVEQKLAELRTTEGNVQLSQFNYLLLSFRNDKVGKYHSNQSKAYKNCDILECSAELLRDRLSELEASESVLREKLGAEEVRSPARPATPEEAQHEAVLQLQVNTLKLQIKDLESEVESKSAELESCEAGYRSEVRTAESEHSFVRYRSMRDHTGRFLLLVKIRAASHTITSYRPNYGQLLLPFQTIIVSTFHQLPQLILCFLMHRIRNITSTVCFGLAVDSNVSAFLFDNQQLIDHDVIVECAHR